VAYPDHAIASVEKLCDYKRVIRT